MIEKRYYAAYMKRYCMSKMDPIKSVDDIEKIKVYLQNDNKRNYLLFIIGINTPLKSNRILKLTFSHFLNEDYSLKDFIELDNRKYRINNSIKTAFKDYWIDDNYDLSDYIFESNKKNEPIDRSHLYRILNDTIKVCNLSLNIGNETLRKTYGYHYYYKTKDVNYLKQVFNKSSNKLLFDYLGIDDISERYDDFCL